MVSVAVRIGLPACGPTTPAVRRAEVAGAVWRERCADPAIVTAIAELRPDGLLGWSYAEAVPDAFRLDSVHTWAVEAGALVVRWSHGAAHSRYRPGPEAGVLPADTSTFCLDGPTLTRLR